MHFINLSDLSAMCRNIQQIGLIKIGFILLLSYQIVDATNYCSLCRNHVACNNFGYYGRTCSADRAILKMDTWQKDYIVQLHNSMRNKLAMGQIPRYSPAAHMPTFEWNDELAYFAELNVRSCVYGHDKCRKTDKFRWAGQNIARRGRTNGYEEAYSAIYKMITDWFSEYKDANISFIDSYHNHYAGKKIGHFTVMANDKNNQVGCAMIRHQERGFKYQYLVYNYGYTNILGRPVYEKGPTASMCKRRNPVYGGLCSTDHRVVPSPY